MPISALKDDSASRLLHYLGIIEIDINIIGHFSITFCFNAIPADFGDEIPATPLTADGIIRAK